MCVATCPHCRVATFDSGLLRCDLCDTWSHLLAPDVSDVCLVGSWAHGHGMVTLHEHIDTRNAARRGGTGQQMTLWDALTA